MLGLKRMDMKLTDTKVRSLKTLGKHFDGHGLYLEITAAGGRYWRMKYRHGGKEKRLAFGVYPEVTLKDARDKAAAARQTLAGGFDPGAIKKAERVQTEVQSLNSFEAVARQWYAVRSNEWAASYGEKIIRRFEVDVFPYVGRRPIDSITPPELLTVLRRIEERGVIETAHRALENCSQVFRFAVAEGKAPSNPARDLKDALKKPLAKHFPAITDPLRLGELLRAMQGYQGTPVVRAALALQPMLLLRPGELRHARWPEFDLDNALWTVPAERMKRERAGKINGKPHIVPLPTQAVAILRELHMLTGESPYVFRGERHHDRPMSENSVNAALRALGFGAEEVTGHGFRATARTLLAEQLGIEATVIEAQLAHSVADSLGRAYNRTEFQAQRRAMLQTWADYLDKLRKGADVIKLHGKAA
jgi:integrase